MFVTATAGSEAAADEYEASLRRQDVLVADVASDVQGIALDVRLDEEWSVSHYGSLLMSSVTL